MRKRQAVWGWIILLCSAIICAAGLAGAGGTRPETHISTRIWVDEQGTRQVERRSRQTCGVNAGLALGGLLPAGVGIAMLISARDEK